MMGRKRKHRLDLPERVYFNHGAYFFAAKSGEWIRLGKEWNLEAKARYAKFSSVQVDGKMSAIMARYMEEIAPTKAPRTLKNNIREIEPLKKVFGHMDPHEVTPTGIYQYMDARPAIAANREVALLSSVFKFAIRKGFASENPCKQVSRNTERPRTRHVEDEEYQKVYEMASPVIQCAMELARQTGLRLGDLLKLNERENVLDDGLYVVTGKTGRKLLFVWTDELRATVERSRSLRGSVRHMQMYLLSNRNGQRYTAFGFATLWQRLMRKAVDAGVERFQFRDLRASAANQSATPSELLGHNNPNTTNRIYRRGPRKVTPNK